MEPDTAIQPSIPSAAPAKRQGRWLMLALVWMLYFSFGVTMGSIAPLVSPILEDLDMNSGQMGLVHGIWQLAYVFVAPPAGAIVDRFGIRKSLGVGAIIMGISMILRGLAVDFVTLLLAVSIFGMGGPIISVGAPKIVSVWFSGRERGIAAGIYTTAPGAGMVFALATASSVVVPLTGSWRGISIIYGAVMVVIIAIWWLLARDAEPGGAAPTITVGSSKAVFAELLRLRNVRLILMIAMGTFVLASGLVGWVPSLLEEKGMTLSQAGLWTAVASGISTVGILIIPGSIRQGYRVPATVILLGTCAITAPAVILFSGPPLITSLILLNTAQHSTLPLTTLLLMETPGVGAERMGAAAGLFFSSAEIGGFGGPLIMGLLRDATGSLDIGFILLACVAAALIPMVPFIKELGSQKRVSQATAD